MKKIRLWNTHKSHLFFLPRTVLPLWINNIIERAFWFTASLTHIYGRSKIKTFLFISEVEWSLFLVDTKPTFFLWSFTCFLLPSLFSIKYFTERRCLCRCVEISNLYLSTDRLSLFMNLCSVQSYKRCYNFYTERKKTHP